MQMYWNKISWRQQYRRTGMEQIIEYQKTYQEYKAELDGELQRTAEGFVRIGYLLKVARDTNILKESGYTNVTPRQNTALIRRR